MPVALITGGTGFLGFHLASCLSKLGWTLRLVDTNPLAVDVAVGDFIQADIRDKGALNEAMAGCDITFHLAAIPSIARAKYEDYHQINVVGTQNVISAAKANGLKHVVHVSSSTVYGIPNQIPLAEKDVKSTVGHYGRSKLNAEKACLEGANIDLSVSIIRPRVIMGQGRIGIFSLLFDSVQSGRPVFLIGNGKNVFQFTAASDMVDAMVLSAQKRATGIFNIGSDDQTHVIETVRSLIRHAGSSSRIIPIPATICRTTLRLTELAGISPLVKEQFEIADKNFFLDTSKAKKELGWEPNFTNAETLIDAFDWYIEHRHQSASQFKRLIGVLGHFRHSQQGAFQKTRDR